MKKHILIALLLTSLTSIGFAQSDFQKGYLVNNSGDTIQGFINNPGRQKTLKKCEFKALKDSKIEIFLPDQIKAFRIDNGSLYESVDVTVNGAVEPVFIEKLVEGILDLFYVSDHNGTYYITRDEEGKLYELKNSKIEVQKGNSSYTKKKREYISSLRFLFKDDPAVISKVDKLPFDTNAMVEITSEYHNNVCDSYECVIYTSKAEKMRIKPGIYVGYAVSHMDLKSEYISRMNLDYGPSSDMFIGASINFMDPNISNRFSLQLEMMIQSGKYVNDTMSFNMQYLKIPFSIIYSYPINKVQPFAQFGVAYNNWLKHEGENTIANHILGDALQKKTYQYGFLLRAGFSYSIAKHLNLQLGGSYERYAGKPYNVYAVPNGFGGYTVVSEYVKVKTDFISISAGLQF